MYVAILSIYILQTPSTKAKERKSDLPRLQHGGNLFNDTTPCKNKKERQCHRNGAVCGDAERAGDGNAAKQNDPSSAPPPSLHPPMNQQRRAKHIPVSSTTTKTSFN